MGWQRARSNSCQLKAALILAGGEDTIVCHPICFSFLYVLDIVASFLYIFPAEERCKMPSINTRLLRPTNQSTKIVCVFYIKYCRDPQTVSFIAKRWRCLPPLILAPDVET